MLVASLPFVMVRQPIPSNALCQSILLPVSICLTNAPCQDVKYKHVFKSSNTFTLAKYPAQAPSQDIQDKHLVNISNTGAQYDIQHRHPVKIYITSTLSGYPIQAPSQNIQPNCKHPVKTSKVHPLRIFHRTTLSNYLARNTLSKHSPQASSQDIQDRHPIKISCQGSTCRAVSVARVSTRREVSVPRVSTRRVDGTLGCHPG
jgi:hypothetical protein